MKLFKLSIFCLSFVFSCVLGFSQKDLNLDDAVMNQYRKYAPDRVANFEWIPETSNYSYLEEGRTVLVKSSPNSNEIDEIIDIATVNKILKTEFRIFYSASWLNKNELLLSDNQSFYSIDVTNKTGVRLHSLEENGSSPKYESSSHQLAYLVENNVMMRDSKSKLVPVTENSDPNIVSGQAIARSEFGITEGLFWSKNGNYLAYYQKDETNVHNYPLLNNEDTPGTLMNVKYPMTGQLSEKPQVGIFNTKTRNTVFINPQGNDDDYLTNLSFTPDEKYVVIAEVNRGQNHMWLNVYS